MDRSFRIAKPWGSENLHLLPAGGRGDAVTRTELLAVLEEALRRTPGAQEASYVFSEELILLGAGGILDSLSAMLLLVNVDALIAERTGKPVEIVSDTIFSGVDSPFRTIGRFADFLEKKLAGAGA